MRLTRGLPILVVAVIAGAMVVRASPPIVLEYGHGHGAAFTLLRAAEKQAEKGDLEGAIANLNRAMQGDPKFWPALYTRAQIYKRQHKWQLAIQDCNELLHQYPYLVEASLLRASVNAEQGNYAESLKEIDHIISIRPRTVGLARALNQRAWLRLTCPNPAFRDAKQALKDAKLACSLIVWKDEEMIDTLALACAQNRDFESAVGYEQKALNVKGISPEGSNMLQQHLAMFKQGHALPTSP
jgi:tetratricopeptide (TPR) repeat protein